MNDDRIYECPLCGVDFTGAACRSACPMSRGCTMVRCPQCSYEFVESGKITDMLLRWVRRAPKIVPCPSPDAPVRLGELPAGSTARVDHIASPSPSRLNRLASFGIVSGSAVTLIAQRPAIVIGCGSTTVAMEDEVGTEIWVRRE